MLKRYHHLSDLVTTLFMIYITFFALYSDQSTINIVTSRDSPINSVVVLPCYTEPPLFVSAISLPLLVFTKKENQNTKQQTDIIVDNEENKKIICNHHDDDYSKTLTQRNTCTTRGGALNGISDNPNKNSVNQFLHPAEVTIEEFLTSSSSSSSSSISDSFHFHGWKWHTLSVIRDSSRLESFANKLLKQHKKLGLISTKNNNEIINTTNIQLLSKAIDHVIDFNLKGLQRIENNVFFPWLKEKLTTTSTKTTTKTNKMLFGQKISNAFQIVIDDIESEKKKVELLAENLRVQAKHVVSYCSNVHNSENLDQETILLSIQEIKQYSNSLCHIMTRIFEKEMKLLIPAIATFIPSTEQIKVNNKILRNLGIFESRAILVGMFETLHDNNYGNKNEQDLFEREIPYIPRMMIPRWKKTLYLSQAGMLES